MTIYTLVTNCGRRDIFIRNFATEEGAQAALKFEYEAMMDGKDPSCGYIEDGYAECLDYYRWDIYETEVEE